MGDFVRSGVAAMALGQRVLMVPRVSRPLHAMVLSAGRSRETRAAYDWHGLKRGSGPMAILQWTVAGSGWLSFEGVRHHVGPGQLMLLTIPHDHRYWFDPAEADDWSFFYLCLNGRDVLAAWQAAIGQVGPVCDVAESQPLIQTAIRLCEAVLHERIHDAWTASAAAYDLSMALSRHAFEQAPPTRREPGHDQSRPVAVDAAIAFAMQHLGDRITVADLAAAAGYSRFHFTRLFHAAQGVSPAAWLLQQRLRLATHLLRTTRDPIKAVAARCGFSSANYFAKAFRQAFHESPATLRRRGL